MTDRPLKIVLILPTITRGGGGVSEAARLLAWEWAQRDDTEIEVVTLRSNGFEEARADWPDIPIHTFERHRLRGFGYAPEMTRFLKAQDYDIAHVHGLWMYHCLAALRWSETHQRPYVVTPHGMLEAWILARSKMLKKAVSLAFHSRFLKRASLFHVLTTKETEDVKAVVLEAKVLVVPNFVPTLPRATQRPKWWRPEMEDRRVLLFFGRIHDKKGWRELVSAWEALSASDPGFADTVHLVFCGWVDAVAGFEAKISEVENTYRNITFAGPQYGEDRLLSYSAADAFILPSKSEGLPMSILEAWAIGLPVLMTEACNLPLGFTQDAAIRIGESEEALREALRDFKALPEARLRQIGDNGQRLQQDVYSAKACSEALRMAFSEIAKKEAV
ncbi:glycosyltransferase [Celeribacter naphthalenivorans]|uniref:glycosyltransferase n=1 Tax=Celeribacter naphthalenivorans TaxID=1614694 RepID=UPI001CF955D3|nr:glycosyltransferase [Celeribacter naphthalenivorans]